MLSFLEPNQNKSSSYMRFSKVFQPSDTAEPKRDKRVQATQTAEQLLQTPERTLLIQEIQDLCAANAKNYQIFYADLIQRFAEFVQLLSDYDHPAYTWLDHHLRLAKTALKMREQFLLVGESLHPIVNEEEALWHYVTFSSALLRKIGLLFTHYQVSICTEQGVHTADWMPFAGKMGDQGPYYKLRDIITQDSPATQNISQLLARQIMPEEGFLWIAKHPKALLEWLGVVEGERDGGVSHHMVILSEKQLYENAKREEVLEQFFRARSLEELLRLTGLTEQQLLKLLPPLHGTENETTELSVAFFEWLNLQNQEGLVRLISERQFLLFPESLMFIARECPGAFKNWFNLYKNSLSLGFTVLTPSDKQLQTFLVQSQHLLPHTGVLEAKTTTDLFHQTLHDRNEPTHTANATQEARVHQQNLDHTIQALNNHGLMVNKLFHSNQQNSLTDKVISQTRQDTAVSKAEFKDQMLLDKKAESHYYFEQRQKLETRQQQLRFTIEKQYPHANAPKSSFSYSRNI